MALRSAGDGVGVGLLDGEDGLRLALGLEDALLFDGVGAEDGGFSPSAAVMAASLFTARFQDDA